MKTKKTLRIVLSLLKSFLVIFLTFFTLFFFTSVFTYFYFAQDLTTKESIMNRSDTGLVLLDRQEKPFFYFYQAKVKTFTPLSQIPSYLQQAIIVSEDKDFYKHPGFSLRGIIRSVILDIKERRFAYGGSTISQQLIKNSLLTFRKDFLRKVQEVVLALELERNYSKKEILEMYLNSVYFGKGAFGVEQASEAYFGKKARDLTLAESSFLVSLLPAPSDFSNDNLDRYKARQKNILQKMVDQGYISEKQKENAKKQKLTFKSSEEYNSIGIHFALMVRDRLVKSFGEENIIRSGFKVKTTLDPDWQKFAEETVKNNVENLRVSGASNGSAVVINPKTGEVKALVGSYDWYDEEFGKYNVSTSLRQPGSSFKPIYYSAAFEKGIITPATILQDRPTDFGGGYKPKDYDGRYRGPVTVRRALSNSLNIPSVEVMSKLGIDQALEMAQRLGLTTLTNTSDYGLSLALGAGEVRLLEMTSAYAVFANNGMKNDIAFMLEIKDKEEKKIYSYKPKNENILDSKYAFLISSILSDNQARAEVFGNTLTISKPAAVKTGTTEDYRDAWTIGYTPSLAVGVWVGNNDNRPMNSIAGSLGAAPVWRSLMEKFSEGTNIETFDPPNGIVIGSVCRSFELSSKAATSSGGFREYFVQGTEPDYLCSTRVNNGSQNRSPSVVKTIPQVPATSIPSPVNSTNIPSFPTQTPINTIVPTSTVTSFLSPTFTPSISP
ncbi:PBP1A family penicillin-binding protein [Candidatus Parcubacteria bacterium]|nr:MAG: PBP1A family penicillin-binding protein [Candidatus Parcubacteria bacterium]